MRPGYGALLRSKLIMQTFLYNYFRIATLVARLIDNEVSFDIFSENLLLSAKYGPKERIGIVFDGEGTLPAWPYSGWITR